MRINKFFVWVLLIGLSLTITFEASAQTKKRKPKTRRATNIVIRSQPTLPPMVEPEVVSRATDELNDPTAAAATNENNVSSPSQKTLPVASISSAAAPIDKKDSAREKEDRSLLDLERLSLAETRAETFRKQLSDVIDREANLRTKIEQLEFQIRPENIQMETSVIGSLRPEEVRESRRKIIENDKTRTIDQLNKTIESRARLELAIASADVLVDKLRARVEAEATAETRKSADKVSAKDSVEPTSPDN